MAKKLRVTRINYLPKTNELEIITAGKSQFIFDMDLIGGDTGDPISAETIKNLTLNMVLNAFRLEVQNSLSLLHMVDAFVDEYEDQNGVDLDASDGQYYDVNLDYYTSAQPTGSTVVLLHGDGSNGSSTITDEKGHTIVNSGVTITTGTSKFGGTSINAPVAFFRIDDNVDTQLGTGDFTIDGWYNLEPGQNTAAFRPFWMIGGDSGSHDLAVVRSGGSGNYDLVVGGNLLNAPITTGFSLPQGSWFHLALTRYGDTITVYVDGVSKGTTTCTGADFTNGLIYFGGKAVGGGGDNYYGKMDEIRIVKGAAMWTSDFTPESSAYSGDEGQFTVNDITLISEAQDADSAPTEARVILFEEDVDEITLNTDLKAYVSRDGGTTFTQVTLEEESMYDAPARVLSGLADISGQPSGTSMVYKITTHNTKNLKLHGASVTWL